VHIDFRSSERSSLGVEVELEIVDRSSRELASAASDILGERKASARDETKAKHELLECTIEMITGICGTVAEARADLESTLVELRSAAESRRLGLMSSGTHPFSHWRDQKISPNPRYDRLVRELQWPARQLEIFGLHVHVGIRSEEKAIAISNALMAYIPHFLALSASSPFWLGEDSGLASSRSKVFEILPTAGLPYQMADWKEFEQFMHTLIAARTIRSIREVWWDIRPHPDFGTVEFRICDGVPTMSEIAALAALSQCLVEWMDGLYDGGWSPPCPAMWIVRENKWRAARHGIDAEIITDEGGSLVPLPAAIRELVDRLTPVSKGLGCHDELRYVLAILDQGPSYIRQRAVAHETGSLMAVVDSLVEELATDVPSRFGTRRA
jgi:glutamate---cysteine ligase / carboxylate-amine ligase